MARKFLSKYPVADYFFIAVGAALMSIGIGVFLVEAKVVPGGVSGLAMAIYYISNNTIPIGLTIWILNIPLFLWGWKELGNTFGLRTFYGFTLNSIFIDLFRGDFYGIHWFRLQDSKTVQDLVNHDFFFLILCGGALLGIGLGIIFKFKGTTAGSDIVGAIMQKKYGWKPGQAILLADFFVIALAGLVIDLKGLSEARPALSLTLYALFLLFISARIIDVIIDGFDYARAVYIITDKYKEMSHGIMHDLSRGATAIKTRGLYRNVDREVILTIVTLKELSALLDMIKEIDPDAFVIINNVHEVLGKGFRRRF